MLAAITIRSFIAVAWVFLCLVAGLAACAADTLKDHPACKPDDQWPSVDDWRSQGGA